WDEHGHDVLDRIAHVDRRYVDDFRLEPIQGYAAEHSITLEIDTSGARRVLLLLTGWTDYAFSSDNVAAQQAGLRADAPAIQIRDRSGEWRTAIREIGLPIGRPQTVVADLTAALAGRPSPAQIRIVSTLR